MSVRPTSAQGNAAYHKGLCKRCLIRPYQPGCTMCEVCLPDPAERLRRAREATYGPSYLEVALPDAEWELAITMGRRRHEEAKAARYGDQHGHSANDRLGLQDHVMGAAGEIACVRHAFGMTEWTPTINTYSSSPDAVYQGKPIEIRTRGHHHWDLMIRPNDHDSWWFVLATWNRDTPWVHTFRVHGWILCSEAKRPKYRDSRANDPSFKRPLAWFVPQCDLHPLEEL